MKDTVEEDILPVTNLPLHSSRIEPGDNAAELGPSSFLTSSTPGNKPDANAGTSPTEEVEELIGNPSHQTNGFPFNAPNGTFGESPTTSQAKVGNDTTASRRSVQFARTATTPELTRNIPLEGLAPSADPQTKEGTASKFLSRIKSLATPAASGQVRSSAGIPLNDGAGSDVGDSRTPASDAGVSRHLSVQTEDGHDADVEESGGEEEMTEEEGAASSTHAKKFTRRSGRAHDGGPHTAPTTPRSEFFPMDSTASSPMTASVYRPHFHGRSATSTDIPERNMQGVSEDEGRDRLSRASTWKKKGAAWVQGSRGEAQSAERKKDGNSSEARRPVNFRRFTTLASASHEADGSPSPWRVRTARTTTASAQKWRQVKAGLKLLGQKRREEERHIDHLKSGELMAELLAGSPAAVIAASMFQRDEHEKKKIPVLLEQLKINITDSQRREDSSGDRHLVFRIELEYGSGLTRMKWVIYRTLKDFVNLHLRFKALNVRYQSHKPDEGKTKLPSFPKTAFPYLRTARGLLNEGEEEENDPVATEEESGPERPSTAPPRPDRVKRRQSSNNPIAHMIRRSSTVDMDGEGGAPDSETHRREQYIERQRKKLERYLQQLIRFAQFRAGSNRLCKYLELSALGIRLAAEGGYHGKEGQLTLQSGKGIDFRRGWSPQLILKRHSPMWFLVRHSYIVCVDSAEDMNIYDVYLVDPKFEVLPRRERLRDQKNTKDFARTAKNSAAHPTNHTLRLNNTERKVKLLAKSERLLYQFEESINTMKDRTVWSKKHRFDSFAPVRSGVFAQWLVDGRDYMWNVSRAISMARDVIYIHDWWLSPELYLRRPAAISQKWRLDRLLKKKAQEGVKVFVIMYRNINSAIPIDSEYSKFSLLDLHPNVFVQRSPNQVRQNVFFWAHHEKVCIVDHTVAFCGGVDLCFGRWDTPQHSLIDDKLTGFEDSTLPKDADHCQLWAGKDYSNPRVLDFFRLDKPYEEMYDRTKVPRMPWHDIGMQIVGQPARDLTRHFVQRWNFILRQRKPSRPTPFLLPPPDFLPADLEALGLDGTCEIQILRSSCEWSMGTPDIVECSIMTAYMKMIEMSEHFVYIENQFFITTCEFEGNKIHNLIGDALVERIIRAHKNREEWLAVILIPLMPGFQNTVDSQDGTSIRLIMQCQFRSICRGNSSIFERLRAAGVVPEEYIQFYSLRTWGKIGPNKAIVTEQLYIHAKVMIVDDRTAIIGSANINERSMLGNRDSEIAAIVRDTDLLPSTMAGEPYKVGRFPHTLRVRLMREHLGVDVDNVEEEEREDELMFHERKSDGCSTRSQSPSSDVSSPGIKRAMSRTRLQDNLVAKADGIHSFNHDFDNDQANNPNIQSGKALTTDRRIIGNPEHEKDVRGEGLDNMIGQERSSLGSRGRDVALLKGGKEVLLNDVAAEGKGTLQSPKKQTDASKLQKLERYEQKDQRHYSPDIMPPHPMNRLDTIELGLTLLSQLPPLPNTDDTDIGGPSLQQTHSKASAEMANPSLADMRRPIVDEQCMKDPLSSSFFNDIWHTVAENNTKLFRQVFRCMPDNQVTNWREYEDYIRYADRFAESQGVPASGDQIQPFAGGNRAGGGGPPGHAAQNSLAKEALEEKSDQLAQAVNGVPREKSVPESNIQASNLDILSADLEKKALSAEEGGQKNRDSEESNPEKDTSKRVDFDSPVKKQESSKGSTTLIGETPLPDAVTVGPKRRRRGTTKSSGQLRSTDPILSKGDAEALCKLIQGNLVIWPTEWLSQEERGGKWLYSVDQMAPLEIYN